MPPAAGGPAAHPHSLRPRGGLPDRAAERTGDGCRAIHRRHAERPEGESLFGPRGHSPLVAVHHGAAQQSDLIAAEDWIHSDIYRNIWEPCRLYWALGATIQYRDRPLALVALFRERDKADFNPKEFHILHTLKDALERKFYDLLAEPAAGVLPAERLRQGAAGYGLTKRETEIAELVCRNLSTEEICEKLYLAPATLSKHLSNIYGKVKVTGRIALMALLTGTANKA